MGGAPSPKEGEPPLPLHGLAASQGVFRTHNSEPGKKLRIRMRIFPSAFIPKESGLSKARSFDQGMTFEPFLRWDLVAELVQSQLHRPPLYMQLTKIKALSSSQLELQIDTGFRKVHFAGTFRSSLGKFQNEVTMTLPLKWSCSLKMTKPWQQLWSLSFPTPMAPKVIWASTFSDAMMSFNNQKFACLFWIFVSRNIQA